MSFLLGVLLLASGSNPTDSATSNPAPAETTAQAPAANAGNADKAEKKICRLQETSESRIGGKRICLTADQWRRVQRER